MAGPASISRKLRPDNYFVPEDKISVSLPWAPQVSGSRKPPPLIQTKAIWDTGASHTTIDHSLVDKLGLIKIRETTARTANGPRPSGLYLANLYLPNNLVIDFWQVMDGAILDGMVLIGMDIIHKSDFAISNFPQEPIFSFRHPSLNRISFS